MSLTDLDRFRGACVYPGELDEKAVERELAAFLRALGLSGRVVRLRAGCRPEDDQPLDRNIRQILAESIKPSLLLRAVLAAFHAVLLPFSIVLALRAARRFRFTPTRVTFVAGAAAAARGARDASDARTADAALVVLDRCAAAAYTAAARAAGAAGVGSALALRILFALPAVILFAVIVAVLPMHTRIAVPAVLLAPLAATFALWGPDRRTAPAFAAGAGGILPLGILYALPAVILVALVGSGLVHGGTGTPGAALAALALFATYCAIPAAIIALGADAAVDFAGYPGAHALGAHALEAYRSGYVWELSWTACALFGAVEQRKPAAEAWLRPLFEAFVAGCWLLYWTDDALYWVAKPTVHREPGTQRLHHDTQAALESNIVNLHFWHGVMVPPFVIARPDLITIARIDGETNAEMRRVMIERYRHGEDIHGAAAFIRDAGGVRLDHDECYGTLWRRNIPGDEPIVMIEVVNRTRESDGTFKRYWLRVPPEMRTAREAVAWTFNMRPEQYAPEVES